MGRSLGVKRAFPAENGIQNPRKGGSPASFSFREMSDFKALRWIFLPAPTSPKGPGARDPRKFCARQLFQ
jgi:hypothetical protein